MNKKFITILLVISTILISFCEKSEDDDRITTGELFYDDGIADLYASPWSDIAGVQIAVKFNLLVQSATIKNVKYYIGFSGVETRTFRVRVYSENAATGLPGEDLLDQRVVAAAITGEKWVEVDLTKYNITVSQGNFFVAMEWVYPPGNNGTNAQNIGVDTSGPNFMGYVFIHEHGWVPMTTSNGLSFDGDPMIRVFVE